MSEKKPVYVWMAFLQQEYVLVIGKVTNGGPLDIAMGVMVHFIKDHDDGLQTAKFVSKEVFFLQSGSSMVIGQLELSCC